MLINLDEVVVSYVVLIYYFILLTILSQMSSSKLATVFTSDFPSFELYLKEYC